jgi:HK97 family phage portal protein
VRLFGLTITRTKNMDLVTHVPPTRAGWWPVIRESFAGAWQRSIVSPVEDALTHPTFWSCVTLIASDIAKGCLDLVKADADGITEPVTSAAFSPVLRNPNHFQNRMQYTESYILSKLCRGNTYVLKARDARGVVTGLYVLDPLRVRPLVGPSGDVFYACQQDILADITEASIVIPAREIIHDRWNTLYHPLVGLSPVYASGHAAMQALTIGDNSTRFFKNGSQLAGLLVAPGAISEITQKRLEQYWNENYAGSENAGKIAVIGDAMKFEEPKRASAVDSQLIEQLKWDDEKICATLHIPGYMVGVGPPPSYNNAEVLWVQYYSQAVQGLIEAFELCHEEGLGVIDAGYELEYDIDALFRMDSATKMKIVTDGIKGMVYTPNDGRKKFNLKPLKGGDTVYGQEQDHAISWLAERDAQGPPPPVMRAAAPPPPASPQKTLKSACETCGGVGLLPERGMSDPQGQLPCPHCAAGAAMALRLAGPKAFEVDSAELLDVVMKGLAA